MKKSSLLRRFLIWRLKNISDKQFLNILSVIIGLAAGFSAVIIKNTVHLIKVLLGNIFGDVFHNYLFFAFPVVGILITILFIRYLLKKHVGHGIPKVLFAISQRRGKIERHNLFSSILTSTVTVGFGGSVGLEGPTVATGAAIGSNLGQLLRLNYKQLALLITFASAGAMAAIFKAPIAAIVFALEVIMLDLTMAALVPLLIASVTGALTSYFFLGQDVLYTFELQEKFVMSDIPFYILLGIVAGFVSLYFARMYMFIGKMFDRMSSWHTKLAIGGIILCTLIYFFPSLYGEGYEAINISLNGDYSHLFSNSFFAGFQNNIIVVILLFLAIILLKVIATSVTFGSGGIGGIFAPTLFIGVNTGLFFAKVVNYLNIKEISESNFALVGMAGLIAGVIHAPLTAIFLIAEITNGYELFMPLMITSTISYATIKLFESNSVYTIQLARRRQLMTHDKDKVVLTLMSVNEIIENDFDKIHPESNLGDLVKIIKKARRNIFPVVDENNTFMGIVRMDDIREIMFKQDLYENTSVGELMYMPQFSITSDELMEDVVKKFQVSGKFNIVVLKEGKYLGFISKAKMFSKYRQLLKKHSED